MVKARLQYSGCGEKRYFEEGEDSSHISLQADPRSSLNTWAFTLKSAFPDARVELRVPLGGKCARQPVDQFEVCGKENDRMVIFIVPCTQLFKKKQQCV